MDTYILNDGPETFTLEQFIQENQDMSEEDVALVAALKSGESVTFFIGAGGEQTITRVE